MRALAVLAFVALASATPSAAQPADVAATVANAAARTPDNVKLDASRKPVEILTFFGLQRGMNVIDMFGANRYWAEIMAPAVGPTGSLVGWNPTQFTNDKRRTEFAEFAARQPNVAVISDRMETPLPGTQPHSFLIRNPD